MSQESPSDTPSVSPSRRSFLASTAAVAGAASALPIELSAQVAGSDEMKVGMIGCGGRNSGAIIQNLAANDGSRLYAVAEAFADKIDGTGPRASGLEVIRKKLESSGKAKQFDVPGERQFVGFDAYKQVIDEVDLVCIATPPGFRPIHFEYAVSQGKHVFMEKPVCVDAHGFNQVIRAAKQADEKGLRVVVGLQRHYQPSYLESFERFTNGEIGEIISAQAYWNGARPWTIDRQDGWTEMEFQVRNWQQFQWLSGDHIAEQHVHNLDVINWFASGDSEMGGNPISAQGMGARTDESAKIGEIFNQHAVEYQFGPEQNNITMSSQCRQMKGTWRKVGEVIYGSEGILDPGKGRITDLKGNVKWSYRKPREGMVNPKQEEHDRLYAAIRENKPLNNAYYGAKSSLTAVLGRLATYSGQMVNWDEAVASDFSLMPETFAFDAQPPVLPDSEGDYAVAIPGQWQLPWQSA
ncbi:MAG: Gfo/Idh/MocA family oxidoreductase [Verrucomicrobiota bacterium]